MAVIGMLFLTALALVIIYVIGCFWFLYVGFTDGRETTKIAVTLVVLALIFGVGYGWWAWIGSNIHVSFG